MKKRVMIDCRNGRWLFLRFQESKKAMHFAPTVFKVADTK